MAKNWSFEKAQDKSMKNLDKLKVRNMNNIQKLNSPVKGIDYLFMIPRILWFHKLYILKFYWIHDYSNKTNQYCFYFRSLNFHLYKLQSSLYQFQSNKPQKQL